MDAHPLQVYLSIPPITRFYATAIVATALLCIVGSVLRTPFLSTALTFMIVYVWARKNPFVLMNFLGVLTFTAPYMPWVLLGFSLLLSGQLPVADLIGIGVGHAYFYLTDVYPVVFGREILVTPPFLYNCRLIFRKNILSQDGDRDRNVIPEEEFDSDSS